jgi:type 2 lantibiotic biosynthesis protein LanM
MRPKEAAVFSNDELRDVAARGSTIDERIAGGYVPYESADEADRAAAQTRLAAWCHSATAGNADLFAKRLALDGLDEHSALALLGRIRLAPEQALPQWATLFAWAATAMCRPAQVPAEIRQVDGAGEPVPFENLLWPIVLAAWAELERRVGDRLFRLISDSARTALQYGLLKRLAEAAARGLFAEFSIFRHLSGTALGAFGWPFWSTESREIYDGFVEDWQNSRGRDYFLRKPVAARLIGATVSSWLDGTAEFVQRLDRDLAALGEAFAGGGALGPVTTVEADLSDSHRGGRRVMIIGFADDTKVVYKPKDLRVDLAWAALLRWLEDRKAPVTLRAPQVLARDLYGWTEHIPADESVAEPDRVTFYRRAGGLLALFRLLRGTDFHFENVIASGGCPVLVDLETLLHPRLNEVVVETPDDAAMAAAVELVMNSVLLTHFLPLVVGRPNGKVMAIGGIDGRGLDEAERDKLRNVNTDAMSWGKGAPSASTAPGATEASVKGSLLAEHAADFLGGFADLYSFLSDHLDEIAAPDGPIQRFRDVPLRVLLNGTANYGSLAWRAAEYKNLGDGADWSLQFDFFGRGDLTEDALLARSHIRAAERRALANLDIPFFVAQADTEWIETCGGERIESCLAGTPFDQVMGRIASLGEDDRHFQQMLIHSALPRKPPSAPADTPVRPAAGACSASGEAIAAAQRLGEIIAGTAVRVNGSAAWIGVVPVDHEHGVVNATGFDLYSGATGIALFLAALWRITEDRSVRDLATAALGPVRAIRFLPDGGARTARQMGIGGVAGVGSLVYGLVRIAGLIEEPALIDEALYLSSLIDEKRIAADRSYDVVQGAAGAVLGLLALHQASGDAAVLQRAAECGRRLLQGRVEDEHGNWGWHTLTGVKRILTGFSHGAAGIALALLRLYRATGDTEFRDAAQEALGYERRAFIPEAGNWPDLRSSAAPLATSAPCQWCHGAAGIGLARLGGLGLIDDPAAAAEIDTALSTTREAPLSPIDHLCCGNFGRLEFLLTAGECLDRGDLVATARERAAELTARAAGSGGFRWRLGDDSINPSFFQGISGIGYEMLRLAAPETLPSILLLE